jgi:hypothetical protein
MARLADRPGYGPARESPSRFQRWLMGAPTPLSSAFFGLALGVFMGLLTLARSFSPWLTLAVACGMTLFAAVGFHLLRSDRDDTAEQRLDTTVKYLPTLRRRR